MFVLDAAMGWVLGGAVVGVVLVGGIIRAAHRRRQGWDRHSMPPILVAADSVSPTEPAQAAVAAPAAAPAAAAPAAAAAAATAPAAATASAAHSPDGIRAELAAHAQRLAAARAARAAATANAAAAAARGADRQLESGPAEPAVFDPTRTTPWQQVVESVARARAGLPSTTGATEALRAAVAAGQPAEPSRAASVKPGEFMVRTAVPRVPPRDPNELGARPRRILVADDARVVRVKLQRLLAAQGWQVIEAADGDEALRALASQGPDLLITDVDMPGHDGFALTRAVRADAATAHLPVVMITAADDEHRDEAARAGVTVLLGKPYGEEALLAHMRRLMGLQPVAATTVAGALDALPA